MAVLESCRYRPKSKAGTSALSGTRPSRYTTDAEEDLHTGVAGLEIRLSSVKSDDFPLIRYTFLLLFLRIRTAMDLDRNADDCR